MNAFAFVLSVLVIGAASPAFATSPSEAGWWWRANGIAQVPARPVPDVPKGGLYVSGGTGGDVGVSALRFAAQDHSRPTTLTLTVADSLGAPVVQVCTTDEDWEEVDGGSWDARPTAECAKHNATGVIDADGSTITFDLSSFPADNGLNLVLLPTTPSDDPRPGAFSTSFRPPDADTLSHAEVHEPTPQPSPSVVSVGQPPTPSPYRPSLPVVVPELIESTRTTINLAVPQLPPIARNVGTSIPASGFAYPAAALLPLALLALVAHLGRTFSRPMKFDSGTRHVL